jgi:hypothetical protein
MTAFAAQSLNIRKLILFGTEVNRIILARAGHAGRHQARFLEGADGDGMTSQEKRTRTHPTKKKAQLRGQL